MEIQQEETSREDQGNMGAQVSTAINLLTNFMREIDDNDLYLKVAQLKTLAERGVITYIAKRLQRIQKDLRRVSGKARMTHDEALTEIIEMAKKYAPYYMAEEALLNEKESDAEIFHNKVSFWNRPSEVHVSSRLAKQALNLGKISLSDGESIAVYEVELTDNVNIERNRRGIRDMLTTDWRNMGYAGAFMFCFRKNESVLRFSYVSETWGFNKQGDYEKISTDTKRYTYLLGEGRGCRTAIEQFKVLRDSKQALSDITAAFSVEALTKQFYKDLFEWYQWAVDPSSNITFPNNTTTEDDDRDDIETKVIRMITRIMFVWFIKQKNLVPDRIFDIDFLGTILKDFNPYSMTVGNFYNAILQNLFFGTLNRAIVDEDGNTRKFATSSKRDIKTLCGNVLY